MFMHTLFWLFFKVETLDHARLSIKYAANNKFEVSRKKMKHIFLRLVMAQGKFTEITIDFSYIFIYKPVIYNKHLFLKNNRVC